MPDGPPHGLGAHDAAATTVPPFLAQRSAVRNWHSISSSSGTQHVTSCTGGIGVQGFGSQEAASTTVPCSSAQSAALRSVWQPTSGSSSTKAPHVLSMVQHTDVPVGGAQGSGKHPVALETVPPSSRQSSGLRSSHSTPSSSGRQQGTSPGSLESSGISPSRTSWPS